MKDNIFDVLSCLCVLLFSFFFFLLLFFFFSFFFFPSTFYSFNPFLLFFLVVRVYLLLHLLRFFLHYFVFIDVRSSPYRKLLLPSLFLFSMFLPIFFFSSFFYVFIFFLFILFSFVFLFLFFYHFLLTLAVCNFWHTPHKAVKAQNAYKYSGFVETHCENKNAPSPHRKSVLETVLLLNPSEKGGDRKKNRKTPKTLRFKGTEPKNNKI